MAKTTFIIRTYNEEKYIGETLERLKNQSRKDFDIVIVDSGSTDDTLSVVKKYSVDSVIRIDKKEYNHSYALNLGIKNADTEFIGIISGHSLPLDNMWYENGIRHFTDNKVAGVTGYCYSLSDGAPEEKLRDLILSIKDQKTEPDSEWMSNTNSLIRKKMWKLYRFDEELEGSEDFDWCQEMRARGYRVVREKKFSVYHSHGGLGRPTFLFMYPRWILRKISISMKKRPSQDNS